MNNASDTRTEGDWTIERSAGAVLVQSVDGELRALLIRVRKEGYEIPKGHVEPGESNSVAALRELREETGVISSVVIGPEIGVIDYSFDHDGRQIKKTVRYFIASMEDSETANFGPLPRRTKELRWMTLLDLPRLPLVNEELRPIVARALAASAAS